MISKKEVDIISYNSFQDCLKQGKLTEVLIGQYLVSKGLLVDDKSMDKQWQKLDVDFDIVNPKTKKHTKLEIKSDKCMHKTGNILLEDCNLRNWGKEIGWLHKCKADVLCVFDEVNKLAYFINWLALKEIAEQFNLIKFWNYKDKCDSKGFVVPIKYLMDNNFIFLKCDLTNFVIDKEAV